MTTHLHPMRTLYGAPELSTYLFGRPDKVGRVYDLHRRTNIPFFKINGTLCALIGELNEWLAKQSAANSNAPAPSNDAA